MHIKALFFSQKEFSIENPGIVRKDMFQCVPGILFPGICTKTSIDCFSLSFSFTLYFSVGPPEDSLACSVLSHCSPLPQGWQGRSDGIRTKWIQYGSPRCSHWISSWNFSVMIPERKRKNWRKLAELKFCNISIRKCRGAGSKGLGKGFKTHAVNKTKPPKLRTHKVGVSLWFSCLIFHYSCDWWTSLLGPHPTTCCDVNTTSR